MTLNLISGNWFLFPASIAIVTVAMAGLFVAVGIFMLGTVV